MTTQREESRIRRYWWRKPAPKLLRAVVRPDKPTLNPTIAEAQIAGFVGVETFGGPVPFDHWQPFGLSTARIHIERDGDALLDEAGGRWPLLRQNKEEPTP